MIFQFYLGQHLRIEDIRQSDQGEYICQAENRFGKVNVAASLKVISNQNHHRFQCQIPCQHPRECLESPDMEKKCVEIGA